VEEEKKKSLKKEGEEGCPGGVRVDKGDHFKRVV